MRTQIIRFAALFGFTLLLTFAPPLSAADNPALWKHQVRGDFGRVLAGVKTALEEQQFQILGEENLSRGLENNRQVFGEDKWNSIGFQNVSAVHFCSLSFNQRVFNLNMDWAILCPFKVVVYNMKQNPDQVTILFTRPTWLLARDSHKFAHDVSNGIEQRIITTIKEGAAR